MTFEEWWKDYVCANAEAPDLEDIAKAAWDNGRSSVIVIMFDRMSIDGKKKAIKYMEDTLEAS